MLRSRVTVLSLLSLLFALVLVGTAGAASAQEDDDDGGLVEVNDNSASALVQACHNNIPVNVLGIQVPVQEIAAALGITLGSDDSPATGPDSSCDQASGHDNQGGSDTENGGSGQDQERENSPEPDEKDEPGDEDDEEPGADNDGILGAILGSLLPD